MYRPSEGKIKDEPDGIVTEVKRDSNENLWSVSEGKLNEWCKWLSVSMLVEMVAMEEVGAKGLTELS